MAPWVGAALVIGLSTALSIAFLHGRAPAIFWDTPTFTEYAASLARGRLPPVGLRLPGYPVFLLLTGGRGIDVHRVVTIQILLWIASNLVVFEIVRRLTRSTAAGLSAALVVLTFADQLFMSITVYSEPLCSFLVLAAALATIASFQTGARRWIHVAAGSWTAAALVRPVFLIAAGVYLAAALAVALRGRLDRRAALTSLAGVAAVVLAVAGTNRVRTGQLQFAFGSGLTLLDYVGHPSVYRNLPPEQARVRDLYLRLARERGEEWIGWWETVGTLAREAGAPLDTPGCDRVARRVALDAIQAVPSSYLAIWRRAADEYLSDVDLVYGWYERPGMAAPQWSAGSWQHRAALASTAFWRAHLAQVTYGSLLLPGVALALLTLARRRRGAPPRGTSLSLATLGTILAAAMLASTALEPWPGQMRYRYPVQHLHVALAVAAVVLSGRALLRLLHDRGARKAQERRGGLTQLVS